MGALANNWKQSICNMRKALYNLRLIHVYLLAANFIVSSCKSTTILPSKAPVNNIKIKELGKEISKTRLNYKNFRARIKTQYDDGRREQQIIVNLRMVNDKTIWMSATMLIPIGKLLMTPEKVSFYEKFQKTFFEGQIKFVSQLFNIDFDFEDMQNILIGYPVKSIKGSRWKRISHPKYYVLTASDNSIGLRPTVFFDPSSFLLIEQRFFVSSLKRTMTIKYNYHQKVEGKYIPKQIEFLIPNAMGIIKIVLEYTKVDFPDELNLPFSIPEGYKPIKFR